MEITDAVHCHPVLGGARIRAGGNGPSRFEALKALIAERKRFDLRKEELTAEAAHERALLRRDLDDRETVSTAKIKG